MASNGTNIENENGTKAGAGETAIGFSSTTLVEVSELLIFGLWMLVQGVNKNLWWHCIFSISQIARILVLGSISKIDLVCHMLAVSEGWSNIIGLPGVVALGITSTCKLCIDIIAKINRKDPFVLWCEITIIVCAAVYLMGVLLIIHGKEANLWIIVGIPLTSFILGCLLKKEDIILLGIMILMSRWDKMKK